MQVVLYANILFKLNYLFDKKDSSHTSNIPIIFKLDIFFDEIREFLLRNDYIFHVQYRSCMGSTDKHFI